MSRGDAIRSNPEFGAWLRRELSRRSISQNQFAESIGVSQGTVSRWVRGRIPESPYLDRIADGLMVSFDLVAEKAGLRPPDIRVDPDSREGQLVPLIRRVVWTDDRYAFVRSSLESMIEVDNANRKKRDQR